MTTLLENGIVVEISITAIKNYKDKSRYDLYLKFLISQHGIAQKPLTIKLTKQIPIVDWDNDHKEVKGSGTAVVKINNKIQAYPVNADSKIANHFRVKRTFTYRDVKEYIKTSLRTELTGDAPLGQKENFQLSQQEHTVDAVCTHYIQFKQLSEGRKKQYPRSIGYLHQYFREVKKEPTPLITQ